MSGNVDWDIDKHREEHESEDHWQLRRKFMVRWKNDYNEERLVCLARVFANIELLGCRYPLQVMQEVAKLSHEVAKDYRNSRMDKLKRTFVSASDAAEDRAKGVKREGGIVVDSPPSKAAKYGIQFVKQGHSEDSNQKECITNESSNEKGCDNQRDCNDPRSFNDFDDHIGFKPESSDVHNQFSKDNRETNSSQAENESNAQSQENPVRITNEDMLQFYLSEMNAVQCVNVRSFNERMFNTEYGRMVLLIRPWTSKLGNIQASCQACGLNMLMSNEGGVTLTISGKIVARASGLKIEARSKVEEIAWNKLRSSVLSVVVKQQFVAQDDAPISMRDVAGSQRNEFGAPVESSVATKMMKLMGWQGGGLGSDAQGIAEPIKPNFQMVNRAGLGSEDSDIKALRRSAQQLMQRFKASDSLDVDLVFSAEFSKEERALLHQIAQRAGLVSRSYGKQDRFLVVRKKLDPFSLARAVIEKGGDTPKYQVFIPAALTRNFR